MLQARAFIRRKLCQLSDLLLSCFQFANLQKNIISAII